MSEPTPSPHDQTLREALASRLIDVRSMPRRLRLITGFVLAQLVVTAILLALRVLPMPLTDSGPETAMPVPILVVTVLFLALSWSLILASAMTVRWPIAILIVALFGYEYLPFGGGIPALVIVTCVASIAIAAIAVAACIASDRAVHPASARIAAIARTRGVALFLPVTLLPYAAVAIWQAQEGHAGYVAGVVNSLLYDALVLVIPALIIAGSDFAEWAQLSSQNAVRGAGRRLGSRALGAAGVAVLAVTVALIVPRYGSFLWRELPYAVGFAALVVAVGLALRRRPLALHVSYVAMVVIVALYVLPIQVGSRIINHRVDQEDEGISTYKHEEEPRFAFDYPSGWKLAEGVEYEQPEGTDEGTKIVIADPSARIEVAVDDYAPYADEDAQEYLLATYEAQCRGRCTAILSPAGEEGGWDHWQWTLTHPDFEEAPAAGDLWQQDTDALGTARVIGYSEGGNVDEYRPTFAAVPDSFTTSVIPPGFAAEDTSFANDVNLDSRLIAIIVVGVTGVIALIALALGVGRGRRMTTGLVFLGLMGLFLVAYSLPATLAEVIEDVPHYEPSLTYGALSFVIGVAAGVSGLLLLARPSGGRRTMTSALLIAAAALALISVLDWVFAKAIGVGTELSWAQAVVILIALSWDVLMSGETITNPAGRWFPRESRVMLFLGFIGFVATAVLFYSSQFEAETGVRSESLFESEGWPRFGITFLGIPLVAFFVVAAIQATARSRGGEAAQAGETAEPSPAR